ncbi:MAG: glycerate kinase, partial [Aureibaculum sp.]|nr:glycerate kinase [Aureibaculum sp.]
MNILLIPDKFKGSLTAKEVIAAIKNGISEFDSSFIVNHVIASDGGDGFIDAIQENNNIELIKVVSVDPLGRKRHTIYGLDNKNNTAYIELANASGLSVLSSKEKNVLKTSTYGTGLQIKHALTKGVKKIF